MVGRVVPRLEIVGGRGAWREGACCTCIVILHGTVQWSLGCDLGLI